MPFPHILDLQRRSPSNFCMYCTDPLLQPQYQPIDRTIPPNVLFLYCCIVVGPEAQLNWNATAVRPHLSILPPGKGPRFKSMQNKRQNQLYSF
jgi:hypothetical protein